MSDPRKGASSSAPLAGVRVIDLSAYIAGPYGGTLLADLGADVIKVEPPDGDNLRKYPSTMAAESRAYLGVNRGKRGICLNLKLPEVRAIFQRMARKADVLLHNFRPSVPSRLGIDYATLSAINPRLVYCAMTGYGQSGPMADHAGYDQVLQARTGICAAQGMGKAGPEIVYGSVVDYYAAAMVANGITAALYQRERTGRGQEVSVSLLGSALAMQAARLVMLPDEPRDINRDMRSGGITGIHPTKSGHLYISANTAHFWRSLCDLIGLPELADDERYDSVRKRAAHADELVPMIRQALAARTALEWETRFGVSVPCAAVRRIEDMFDDPQVNAQEFVVSMHHCKAGPYKSVANLIKFGGNPEGTRPCGAPGLGEHNRAVLSELGFSEEEITAAIATGAVAAPEGNP